MVYFITGIPGTGKTTFAEKLLKRLPKAAWLDGDVVRTSISRDLGYTSKDRARNISRIFSITRMLVDDGRNVVISMVAPLRDERAKFKEYFQSYTEIRLTEVFERRPGTYYEFIYEESDYPVVEGIEAAESLLDGVVDYSI